MNDNTVQLPMLPLDFQAVCAISHGEGPRKSEYVPGLWYTVQPGNEALLRRVMEWEAKGLVHVGERPLAKVQGVMRVV